MATPGDDGLKVQGTREFDFTAGEMLLVNKPLKWTSFDVVNKIRNALKPARLKVGHAGTLDPLATGLLIICTGKLTKAIDSYQAEDKLYIGKMILGKVTPSYDLETKPEGDFATGHLNEDLLTAVALQLTGNISQYPPAHSAVKVGGERVYEKARRGEVPELKSRQVQVHYFKITLVNLPEVCFEVKCSKGTYIRTLVNDFGKLAGSGAYLAGLCRTGSGPYRLEDAWDLGDLLQAIAQHKKTAYGEAAAV